MLNAPLIASSRVIMEKIYSMISGKLTTMVLTNNIGMVLRVLPEDSESPVAGMFSRKEYLDTIGIGTCLEEKRQIEIFGAEHYCREHHGLVCSAANKSSGGMLITLKEMGRMREFANRMTGMKPTFQFNDTLGSSVNIVQTINIVKRIAPSNSTVLLLGESGTGKYLFTYHT